VGCEQRVPLWDEMEVRDWLKQASASGKKPVTQIVLEGERFDVMRVRRWRERVLGGGSGPTR